MEMLLLYPRPHDHTRWADHIIRVDQTIRMAEALLPKGGTVADLSCGDAAIARSLQATHAAHAILGDYAAGYEYQGRIEETIQCIAPDAVDLWVLSETLEHLDDPEMVLCEIRRRAKALVLSTPDGENGAGNPEHIWSWDCEEVGRMLEATGWTPELHKVLEHPAGGIYSFQLWGSR
jgi:hypothetical protein